MIYGDELLCWFENAYENSNCNLLTACVEVTHLLRVLIVRDKIFEKF